MTGSSVKKDKHLPNGSVIFWSKRFTDARGRKRVAVYCSKCGKVREVCTNTTYRKSFTGLCPPCAIGRVDIPRAQLEQLYCVERLTLQEIATQFGCDESTVGNRMREYNIERRNAGDYYRIEISHEILERLYWQEGLSQKEIAKRIGCSRRTISDKMAKYGIKTRPCSVSTCLVPKQVFQRWSPELAYVVGLIAADGCLSTRNPNLVSFTSKDTELIQTYQYCLQTSAPAYQSARSCEVRISDSDYRAFLESIGLTPAKSKTIGPLKIPDKYFRDFMRGCIDGDGCISSALVVIIGSASSSFIGWLQETVTALPAKAGSF
jgi:transposase